MKKILQFALVRTMPVLFGYLFLGIAFGLLLQRAGYHFIWALFISTVVYAGSMQFVLIGFLGSEIGLLSVVMMTLSVNLRHIFYGLSFVDKFKRMKKAYPYMIFSLTDETYSLLCATKVPEELDEHKTLLSIAFLDQLYWIIGSVIGAVLGEVIPFDATGIEFAMTALFVVIFLEQWLSAKTHIPAMAGLLSGAFCLVIFGPGSFILPAMLVAIGIIFLFKTPIQRKEEKV